MARFRFSNRQFYCGSLSLSFDEKEQVTSFCDNQSGDTVEVFSSEELWRGKENGLDTSLYRLFYFADNDFSNIKVLFFHQKNIAKIIME